ncbi:MAG: FAD-dependent thymidylate synthase [Firmicutes bacterium]|nr:FAD-dependent thymidylate synthase [Bacillota bacterium]
MNLKVDLLPNYFLKTDGTFDKSSAILLSGRIAGICYDKEGFKHLEQESIEKTLKRVQNTLYSGHHSVYDHIYISFNIQNIPKILAMILNNERQYTTSEKSARYTPIEKNNDSIITNEEVNLYYKWLEIFKTKISQRYGNVFKKNKITKLAQENARYLITVFMPTQMIYTTSLRQINYIVSWLDEYRNNANLNNDFEKKLCLAIDQFINELDRLNVLESGLLKNEKNRKITLFGENLDLKKEIFQEFYLTTYKGSFAQYAQAQRHRSLAYQLEILAEKEYFIPPIIEDDQLLVEEWLNDLDKIKDIYPQGELVLICEMGSYEDFILKKCTERLCSEAQLEINNQTKVTLEKYYKHLSENNHPLAQHLNQYRLGARCTFPNFKCSSPCSFEEGIKLKRKI